MHNRLKVHTEARRHGKRQVDSIYSVLFPSPPTASSFVTSLLPSEPSLTRNTLPIPPLPTTLSLTIIPSTGGVSIIPLSNPVTVLSASSSSQSSSTLPTSSNPHPPPPSSTSPPVASSQSSSAAGSTSMSTGVTSFMTTMSDAHPVVVTTVIRPAASLSPNDNHSNSFLDNKAESGAVFGVVGLVVVTGFGFLAYRFYKTVQRRKTDRDTEEAARAAARVRVRLDDGDEDGPYNGRGSVFSSSMAQFRDEPHSTRGGHSVESSSDFDRTLTTDHAPYIPFSIPLQSPGSLHTVLDGYSAPTEGYDAAETAYPAHRRSKSGESSSTFGGRSSTDHLTSPSRSATKTSRSSSTARRPLSGSFTSISDGVTRSRSSHYTEQPPLPVLPLPAVFGEGERPSTVQSVLGDEDDYHGTTGRVLKIANE